MKCQNKILKNIAVSMFSCALQDKDNERREKDTQDFEL